MMIAFAKEHDMAAFTRCLAHRHHWFFRDANGNPMVVDGEEDP